MGTHMLLGQRPEGICNYGGCPHGEEGDRGMNMTQGHIQLVSKLGMSTGMCTTAVEQSKKCQYAISWK